MISKSPIIASKCEQCYKVFRHPITTIQFTCNKECRREIRGGKKNMRRLI